MAEGDFRSVPATSGLGAWTRTVCSLIAITLTTLVVLSFWLKPEPSGLGTHQQLGLPPCTIRVLYGIRCPACGMTTSWAYLTHGQVIAALSTNVAGVCLAVLNAGGILVLARMAYTGTPASGAVSWTFALGLLAAITIAVTEWLWRIA